MTPFDMTYNAIFGKCMVNFLFPNLCKNFFSQNRILCKLVDFGHNVKNFFSPKKQNSRSKFRAIGI